MAKDHISDGSGAAQVTCRKCGEIKTPEFFYAAHIRACGTVGECKECTKARVKHRARTDPKVQAYDRARAKLSHRRANSNRVSSRWNSRNPEGYKAHYLLGNAVRDGRIQKQPCLFCGAEKVHAHHRDYSRPLDVIWLCPKCHHRLHAAFPETEGQNKAPSQPEVR